MRVRKIKFQGQDFILTSPNDNSSPIVTVEQFQKGHTSYAHLYEDGTIKRFGALVGTKADIEFGKIIEIEVDMNIAIPGLVSEKGILTAAIEKLTGTQKPHN